MVGPTFSTVAWDFVLTESPSWLLTCHPCMRPPLRVWCCRGGSLQAEVMRSGSGLCATGSTPTNELIRWDSESRAFIRVSLRLHKVPLQRGCRHEAAVPHVTNVGVITSDCVEQLATKESDATFALCLFMPLCRYVMSQLPTAPCSAPAVLTDVNEGLDRRDRSGHIPRRSCVEGRTPTAKNTHFGSTSASFHSLIGFPPPSLTSCDIKINECGRALKEFPM